MLSALLLVAVPAEPTFAGSYVVRACDIPGHPPATLGPWIATPAPEVRVVDRCASGGGVSFELSDSKMMAGYSTAALDFGLAEGEHAAISFEQLRLWASTRLSGAGDSMTAAIIGWQTATGAVAYLRDGLTDSLVAETLARGEHHVGVKLTCTPPDRPTLFGRSRHRCGQRESREAILSRALLGWRSLRKLRAGR
jgi:hypothetical protein